MLKKIKTSFRRAGNKLNNAYYEVRAFFFPYNIVKIKNLPRTWCDRDEVMLHAMFQILVDFVELEQPFVSWDYKFKPKRFTDRKKMREWIETHYNDKSKAADHYGYEMKGAEELENAWKEMQRSYRIYSEILYLYEWYKDKKYEYDFMKFYAITDRSASKLFKQLDMLESTEAPQITISESIEIEDEHEIICNRMLHRLLEVRQVLWT